MHTLQIIISDELGHIAQEIKNNLLEEIDHIDRMARNLIKSLR